MVSNQAPIVLIGGFLAPCSESMTAFYWGEAMASNTDTKALNENNTAPVVPVVIPIHPSPVASAHDRAREIFYALKGKISPFTDVRIANIGPFSFLEKFQASSSGYMLP